MSICIIGSGLAGLTTAIKTKIGSPQAEIVVLEKKQRESNTQIAGMRFRERLPTQSVGDSDLGKLFASRNQGIITPEMQYFSDHIVEELQFWQTLHTYLPGIQPLPFQNEQVWFGPQWGDGKGIVVLKWLESVAQELGIHFIKGEVLSLKKSGSQIEKIQYFNEVEQRLHSLYADLYVLAGGSVGGSLFNSTNKEIRHSSQELAFQAGLPLVGGTTNMIHPFGRCREDGTPAIGCFATDDLAGFTVRYQDGSLDEETTHQLASHTAHDYFPEIAQRFWEKGGVVQLESPAGEIQWARVSHHYSQFGIKTKDTVAAAGVENLYVAGDAASWLTTNYATRFPGVGLSKCLIDAKRIQERIAGFGEGNSTVSIADGNTVFTEDVPRAEKIALRELNTHFLLRHIFFPERSASGEWQTAIQRLGFRNLLTEISEKIASAHDLLREGKIKEPYDLVQNEGIIGEHLREIRPLFSRSKERL